jgi:rfaE bifunctional protein kinase chain/domain
MDIKRLEEILNGFGRLKIAVAGDFFLDRIFTADRALDEPSVETGLTAYQIVGKKTLPGAAGTVTNNLWALGIGGIYPLGLTGDDGEAYDLIKGLEAANADTRYMVASEGVFTPAYTKTMFASPSGMEETHRIDILNRKPTPAAAERRIIENLNELAEGVDAIIALEQLEDGSCGVFTDNVLRELSDIAKKKPGLVIIADSRYNIMNFRGVITKCNESEAVRSVRPELSGQSPDDTLVDECALEMARNSGRPAFVSCGERGMKIADCRRVASVPAIKVNSPIDICGAGDSATAAIASALGAGASTYEAALIANIVASVTIRQIGVTGTADPSQIMQTFNEHFSK